MEKMRIFFLNIRLFILFCLYHVISVFNKNLGKKYKRYIKKSVEKYACKAIRNGWTEILLEKMDIFCKSPKFRRELIVSEQSNKVVLALLKELRKNSENFIVEAELELLVCCRKFYDVDDKELYPLRKLLLSSSLDNKKDIVKLFYKNSERGETNDTLALEIIKMFVSDFDFIVWQASHESSVVLKNYFIQRALSMPVDEKLKKDFNGFVKSSGFAGCTVKWEGVNELLLNMRPYLWRIEDLEVWESYLLDAELLSTMKTQILKYGIKTQVGISKLLELNNNVIINAYNQNLKSGNQ